MSYFPSYSQWLAERANSLEGLKQWMHEMAGWRGRERERERESCKGKCAAGKRGVWRDDLKAV
jgi:hypothetical protein